MKKTLTAEAIHLSRGFFQIPFVRAIEKEFGFKGSKLLIDVLFEVTETGYECRYNRAFRDVIAKRNNVSERLVDMVVHRMVKNGYLDQAKYASNHVLSIPSRYLLVGGSKECYSLPYYFVVPSKEVNSEETAVNSEETLINSEETTKDECLLQNNSAYGTSEEERA